MAFLLQILSIFKKNTFLSLKRNPTQRECDAMQRVRNKIKNAGIEFDLLSCVQLTKVFTYYKVEGFIPGSFNDSTSTLADS